MQTGKDILTNKLYKLVSELKTLRADKTSSKKLIDAKQKELNKINALLEMSA